MRRVFFAALFRQVGVIWPIVSGVLLAMASLGMLIGYVEGWRVDVALYFTFVTGLTIGYGDFAPQHGISRLLAIGIGFAGLVLTGLVAALIVQALREATESQRERP